MCLCVWVWAVSFHHRRAPIKCAPVGSARQLPRPGGTFRSARRPPSQWGSFWRLAVNTAATGPAHQPTTACDCRPPHPSTVGATRERSRPGAVMRYKPRRRLVRASACCQSRNPIYKLCTAKGAVKTSGDGVRRNTGKELCAAEEAARATRPGY